MTEAMRPMDPDLFARRVLAQLERNRSVIIVPAWWRVFDFLQRLSRPLADAFSRRAYRAQSPRAA